MKVLGVLCCESGFGNVGDSKPLVQLGVLAWLEWGLGDAHRQGLFFPDVRSIFHRKMRRGTELPSFWANVYVMGLC